MQEYKVSLIGNANLGKSSFITKIITGEFETKTPTMGVEVYPVKFNNKQFNVWDCAGDNRFGGLRDGYYLNSEFCIIMFDNTQFSQDNVKHWYNKFKRICPDGRVVVLNNRGSIKSEKLSNFLRKNQIRCFDVNIKDCSVEDLLGVFDFN